MNEASPIVTTTAIELPTGTLVPALAHGNIGVLLVNLGTPDTADAAGVRRYLKEFLSVLRVFANMRRQPTVRFAPPYYNDQVYIEALAASTSAELKQLSFVPEIILASFHGMPQEYVDKGDPYYAQCLETTRLLREQLKL